MKRWFSFLLGATAALLFAPPLLLAQQPPVVTVGITKIMVNQGTVGGYNISTAGSGYLVAPGITISGSTGSGATATSTIDASGAVTFIGGGAAGSGYKTAPTVTIAAPPTGGTQAVAQALMNMTTFNTPTQNEAYGPYGYYINIFAKATGTFPSGGYTYKFYVNGTSIGSPVNVAADQVNVISWAPPQPGAYYLTVTASDGSNEATSLAVRYFATGTAIVSPVDNTIVPIGSSVVIQATSTPAPAAPNAFVKHVNFYADGVQIGASDTTYPYSIIYTPPAAPASHIIEARAFDNNNNQISPNGTATETLTMVTAVGTPPTCTLSSPANNAAIAIPDYVTTPAASIPIAVDANSSTGTISKVELYVDGVLFGTSNTYPYRFAWKPTVVGTYRLVALAYDDKNNVIASTTAAGVTPAPTTVTIAALPTVTVTTPSAGSTLTGGSSTVLKASATASGVDSLGVAITISSVQFYFDGIAAGPLVTVPNAGTTTYQAAYTPTQKLDTNGNPVASSVTAIAYNSIGLSAVSTAVSVSVTSGGSSGTTVIGVAPTVSVAAPAAAAQLPVNIPTSLTVTTGDTDGFITGVQFYVNNTATGPLLTSYPYSTSWTPVSVGVYSITAKTTDNDGNSVTSVAVSVTARDSGSLVTPSTPTVSILAPAAGAVPVGVPVSLRASASDDVSVQSVQFYVNGVAQGAALTTFPYTISWTPPSVGAYTISAIATDNIGNKSLAATVALTATTGGAPSITFTSSATSPMTFGATSTLSATASDADGSIAQVQFLANGLPLAGGTFTSPPYSLNWAPTSTGVYTLTATATDNSGNTTQAASVFNYTVTQAAAPTVWINNPASGASYSGGGEIIFSAGASAASGATVTKLNFILNGAIIGTTNKLPYTLRWTPSSIGSYSLVAQAVDSSGNVANSSPATTFAVSSPAAASLSLVSPANLSTATLGGSVVLYALAGNATDTIADVTFYANNQQLGAPVTVPPYTLTWTPGTAGAYSVHAVATDKSGNATTSTARSVTIAASIGVAPSVGILSPAKTVALTTASRYPLLVGAVDTDGTISRVDVYDNGSLFVSLATAPYSSTWSPTSAGVHRLHAIAVDNSGNTVSSTPVDITVAAATSQPPNITLVTPASSLTYATNQTISLTASAGDTDGFVSSVQYFANGLPLGSSAAYPYAFAWKPSAAGRYVITATATDNSGNIVTAAASPTISIIQGTAPSVQLTSPLAANSYPVAKPITFSATAAATNGSSIAKVDFILNGAVLNTDTQAPYTFSWTPTYTGAMSLVAQATDASGNVTDSTVVAFTVAAPAAPTVSLTSPVPSATYVLGSKVILYALAGNATNSIADVTFYVDNQPLGTPVATAPYTMPWQPGIAGTYSLKALATDKDGNTTFSAAQSITLAASVGVAPSVAITAPSKTASLTTISSTPLVVAATDTDGTISRVDLYDNGTLLNTYAVAPYSMSWMPATSGNHRLYAVAVDNAGNASLSDPVDLVIATATSLPPTISLAAPLAGATIISGQATTLTASANDPDGTITGVQFFANGILIGSATSYPFNLTWTPLSPGSYQLSAAATDNSGNITTTSSSTAVTVVQGAAPTVAITFPATSSQLQISAPVTLSASVGDSDGYVTGVQFYVNNQAQGPVLTNYPYSTPWTPTALGYYAIKATATDNDGNVVTSAVSNITVRDSGSLTNPSTPVISFTSPAAGTVPVGIPLALSATASDDVAVKLVQFYINGQPQGAALASYPYTISWTPPSNGSYTVTAIAIDNVGNQSLPASVALTATTGTAPSLSFTTNSTGSLILGGTATLSATATDLDGSVAQVQFLANGVALTGGTFTKAPYVLSWIPSAAGRYTLSATATDNSGNTTTSPSTVVLVTQGTAPTVSLSNPVSSGSYPAGKELSFIASAAATNLGASISKVDFLLNGSVVGTALKAPYVYKWTPSSSGSYSLVAEATDSSGNLVASTTVLFTVTVPVLPAVSLVSPVSGSSFTLGGSLALQALAGNASDSIASVSFYVNNQLLGTPATLAPYATTWKPGTAGTYALTAVATDKDGNAATTAATTVTITAPVGTAPTVAITSPAAATVLTTASSYPLAAGAVDTDGSISRVDIFDNGSLVVSFASAPYATAWTPSVAGKHRLVAVATDNSGNSASSDPVDLTVTSASSRPPTISLLSPASGSIFTTGLPTLISASASDTDGNISQVQFYANGVQLGFTNTYPYSLTWTPSAIGSFSIMAVAVDNSGNQAASPAAIVTVLASAAPSVTLTRPAANATLTVNQFTSFSVNTVSSTGISQVQYYGNGVSLGTTNAYPFNFAWKPASTGTYSLVAVATDGLGVKTSSAALTVSVVAGQSPVVSIAAPLPNASVVAGSPVIVLANASDPDGSVSSVRILANGQPVGTKASAPYSIAWTPTSAGSYSLVAEATDDSGNVSFSAPVSLTVRANQAPLVSFATPLAGATPSAGSLVPVLVNASDADGSVAKVRVLINGVENRLFTAPSYSYNWVPAAPGIYTFVAEATDDAGNVSLTAPLSITVRANQVPVVSFATPLAGASPSAGSTVAVLVTATDADGFIGKVRILINGAEAKALTTPPYAYDWKPTAPGLYRLVAEGTDDVGGLTTTAPLSITVRDNQPPTVSISSPANGSSYPAGSSPSILVTASDSDGTIAKLRLLANGSSVPVSASAPYSATLLSPAPGTYNLVAEATDDSGNVTSSAPVSLIIRANQLPVVSLTAPTKPLVLLTGTALQLSASASDPDGSITLVEFLANDTLIGSSSSSPYTYSWTPSTKGTYAISARATDNAGGSTLSTKGFVRVIGNTDNVSATVYSGTYLGGSEAGHFALVNDRGSGGALIAWKDNAPAKAFLYTGITMNSAGAFTVRDAANKLVLSGTATDTGVSGTLTPDGVTRMFIGQINLGTSPVATGIYSGGLSGRPASTLTAIVGLGGTITLGLVDGSTTDAGSTALGSDGAFTLTTVGGNTITGRIDSSSGFLTATVTGTISGTLLASSSSGAPISDGTLRNLSTLGQVGTGEKVLVAGFVVAGSTPKQILVRVVGPTLGAAPYNVPGVTPNPSLALYSGQTQIASNDNWGGTPALTTAMAAVGAFPLPAASKDAALIATLAPGNYSAQASEVSGATGSAIIELYDLDATDPFSPLKLLNISSRAEVGPSGKNLVAGFAVNGSMSKKILIRAVGPTLSKYSITTPLPDPLVQLHRIVSGVGTLVRENDNWEVGNDAALVSEATLKTSAFPLPAGSKDAIILMSLPPGLYSATVKTATTATGIALVEVYELP